MRCCGQLGNKCCRYFSALRSLEFCENNAFSFIMSLFYFVNALYLTDCDETNRCRQLKRTFYPLIRRCGIEENICLTFSEYTLSKLIINHCPALDILFGRNPLFSTIFRNKLKMKYFFKHVCVTFRFQVVVKTLLTTIVIFFECSVNFVMVQ